MKPSDIDYYMDIAQRTASRSTAERLKVGAVAVTPDNIQAVGYNGTPPKWDNVCEDDNGKSKPEVIHAEMNALFKLVNGGLSTKGAKIFQTHSPCIECAKAVFLSNVSELYYSENYRSLDGVEFLRKAGVKVIQWPLTNT